MNCGALSSAAHAVAHFDQLTGACDDWIAGIGFNPHGQARQIPAAGLKRGQFDLRRGDLKDELLITAGVRSANDRELVALGPRIDWRSMPEPHPTSHARLYQPVDGRRVKLIV